MTKPTVVIGGYKVASFPEGGGHFWVYMQYALGLRQLGCDVYWLEQFRASGDESADESLVAAFRARMDRFGLGGKLILYNACGPGPAADAPQSYMGLSGA